jgi:copper chaperone CopZ
MFEGDHVVTFQVEGMACRNCAREIAHEIEELPGVKAAMIDFDTKTAKVALQPTNGASMDEINAAVEHWRVEHFGVKDDPDCLDPARREELQREMQAE